jgi:Uncharacterized protein conserved in bacteria (DUF2188)
MARKTYHVIPAGDVGWRVRRAGAGRADSVHSSKAGAVARAKKLANRATLGQVKVHRADGAIQTEVTYRKDPRRSPG